jgi:hypothetical protein
MCSYWKTARVTVPETMMIIVMNVSLVGQERINDNDGE